VTDNTKLNAQVSKGFRLGGINDPLNVPLCTPEDLQTFGGRDRWDDETLWNYELGSKSTFMGGRGSFNVAGYYMDISDLQATVTAGTCSSRVIFNVPEARSQGLELELAAQPSPNFDFALSASYNDSELESTLTSTDDKGRDGGLGHPEGQPPADGARAPGGGGGDLPLGVRRRLARLPHRHLPARRLALHPDRRPGGGLRHGRHAVVRAQHHRRAADRLDLHLRPRAAGLRRRQPALRRFIKERWDVALFVNNVTDERALLALDQERGTRARVGYLTNQPRTFGVTTRVHF
jgi:iron complex outermembrane recepter protein